MWTPGGKHLQMQVLYIIRFADGCCILSWLNLPKKKGSSISPTSLDWRTDIFLSHIAYFITFTTDHICIADVLSYKYKHIYATRFLCTPIHSWGQMFVLRPCPVLPSNRFRWATESDLTSDSELTCPGGSVLGWFVKHEIFTIFHKQKRGNMWNFPCETWDFHHLFSNFRFQN